jgi:hypothetical protein
VDFKLENVLVSIHSLKPMGLGTFGASAPLFLRNGELLGHSPMHKLKYIPLKFTCDVNLLSKLSIIFKEGRVMNNADRGGVIVLFVL